MKKVQLFFDFLSPFSYLALKYWQREQPFWLTHGIELEARPVSMIPLIKAWDTKGPAEIAPKRDFLYRQLLRLTRERQIPFATPVRMPFMSLTMLRMVIWAQEKAPAHSDALIQVLADAAWAHRLDVEDDEVLKKLWTQCGIEPDLLPAMQEREGRRLLQERLRDNVALAQQQQAFGVPTFIWRNELFWGADAIGDLQRAISGQDLLDRAEYQRYLDLVYPNGASKTQEWQ